MLVVGRLCMLEAPPPTFTTDSRPPAVGSQPGDSDDVSRREVGPTAYEYPIVVGPPCVASKMAGLRRPRLLAALSGSLSSSARIPGRDLGGRRFVSAGDRRHAFGHFWTAHTLDKLLSNNGGGESENEKRGGGAAQSQARPRWGDAGLMNPDRQERSRCPRDFPDLPVETRTPEPQYSACRQWQFRSKLWFWRQCFFGI